MVGVMAEEWRLDTLARLPLFSGCSRDELRSIARASFEQRAEPGEVVVEEGEDGRECYVIVEGSVVVTRNGEEVALMTAGSAVGELALLDPGPRTATVVARTPVRMLVLGSVEFEYVVRDSPSLARHLLGTVAHRLREVDEQAYG